MNGLLGLLYVLEHGYIVMILEVNKSKTYDQVNCKKLYLYCAFRHGFGCICK